jgi:hypothetical protein
MCCLFPTTPAALLLLLLLFTLLMPLLLHLSCCNADWRLDVNSMNRTGQLAVLRARIQAVVKQFNETVILVGYSQGNLVALGLLKDPKV